MTKGEPHGARRVLYVAGLLIMTIPGPVLGYLLFWRQGRYVAFCALLLVCSMVGNSIRTFALGGTRAYVERIFERQSELNHNRNYLTLSIILAILAAAVFVVRPSFSMGLSALFFVACALYYVYLLIRDRPSA